MSPGAGHHLCTVLPGQQPVNAEPAMLVPGVGILAIVSTDGSGLTAVHADTAFVATVLLFPVQQPSSHSV